MVKQIGYKQGDNGRHEDETTKNLPVLSYFQVIYQDHY